MLDNGSDYAILDHLTITDVGYNALIMHRSNTDTDPGCNYGIIRYSLMEHFMTAIYVMSNNNADNKNNNWWIHHNTIQNGWQNQERGGGDYHGICFEAGNGQIIEYNTIKHVGTVGILLDPKKGYSAHDWGRSV